MLHGCTIERNDEPRDHITLFMFYWLNILRLRLIFGMGASIPVQIRLLRSSMKEDRQILIFDPCWLTLIR